MRGFFGNLQARLSQFMVGRNGMDTIARYAFGAAVVLVVIDLFLGTSILSLIALLLLVYTIYRTYSKNVAKRASENARFESWIHKPRSAVSRMQKRWQNRSTTKYFKCSHCGQSLSVPKNKGTLRVTCPKCHNTTTIKS